MAQTSLVEMQIQDGQRLLERLAQEGVVVTAACWVLESDSGQWYLYLATPLVGENGSTRPAYRRVNAAIREMEKEGNWMEPLDNKKVIGPHDPIAKDIMAYRDGRSVRTPSWFPGSRLGELAVEAAYVYPAPQKAKEAGVS